MKRRIVLLWLAAMLLAVVVGMWPARSWRSTNPVQLGVVVDGGIEEPPPTLVTTTRIVRRGALVGDRPTAGRANPTGACP